MKICIFSGGMDSATLLTKLVKEHGSENVVALSFNYGQRHKKELEYAAEYAKKLGVKHTIVPLELRELLAGSSLTSDSIDTPHGHYADENMKLTVVPNRNAIMLMIAVGHAVSVGADEVYFGAHSGDHAIYPDCRKEFLEAIDKVSQIANYHPVSICAPFIDIDKGDIALLGKSLGINYDETWTCYEGKEIPCGLCGSCTERTEALAKQ